MLNCKCPNKCVVYRFYGFICDFLEFPSVKFSRLLRYIEYGGIRILNTKKVGLVLAVFFFNFGKFMSFTTAEKLVRYISLENELQLT